MYYTAMNQADGVIDTNEPGESSGLMFSLIHAARLVEDRLEDILGRHQLSLAKLNVLNRLAESGEPLTLGEIAARLSCVRSNVTQLVDRLEADGLVRREADATDRRSIRAVLTLLGREKQAAGSRDLIRVQSAVAEAIAGHDYSALERTLSSIR